VAGAAAPVKGRARRLVWSAAGLLACAAFGVLHARWAERRHPPRGRFVGPPGRRIHYVQAGRGPDVILIHGTAVTLDDMLTGPFQCLAGRYRVTAIDRPGHGYSDASTEASAEAQAAVIRRAARDLGLVRPIVVGHSLGGAVALAYALQWPEEIAGVVALAPLAYPDWTAVHFVAGLHALPVVGPLLSRTLFAVSDAMTAPLACRFAFAPRTPTQRFRRDFPTALTSRPVSTCQDGRDVMAVSGSVARLSPGYRHIEAPVAILAGANDLVLSPRRHACRLAGALGGRARLTIAPRMGHMLHHFCGPQILEALDGITAHAHR
jgi:pimeloyl-ACP methyl ester carboxylesterase